MGLRPVEVAVSRHRQNSAVIETEWIGSAGKWTSSCDFGLTRLQASEFDCGRKRQVCWIEIVSSNGTDTGSPVEALWSEAEYLDPAVCD
jgi:hypothetical protein